MNTLSITTCPAWPQPPQGLLLLAGLLAQKGIETRFPLWRQCLSAEAVLPLCAWDYAESPQAFSDWLNRLHAAGTRLPAPPALMQWNLRKSYLTDLAALGAPAVPAVCLEAEECLSENFYGRVNEILRQQNWQDAVIKPLIGQSGNGVCRIAPGRLPNRSGFGSGALVQPFIPEAQSGEYCLIFLQGRFSHAVRRRPVAGEWRANSRYGARVSLFGHPSARMIKAAAEALRLLPAQPLYARVDMIPAAGGHVWLNEIELIDPALYLEYAPPSCTENFAAALAGWLAP